MKFIRDNGGEGQVLQIKNYNNKKEVISYVACPRDLLNGMHKTINLGTIVRKVMIDINHD